MSKCKRCNGLGYLEFEHGLIQIQCPECKGTGEIRKLSEKTKQKISGNTNKKNGKHNRNDR